ncbi:MAG: sigma-54-dependent Fis family transcriptional regulator, partial [Candidatus Obscuribacterales bacterium]|nr:sigma-54-dependent Fis family transcriptional regulator [Steroidobacteraceae bacterium]
MEIALVSFSGSALTGALNAQLTELGYAPYCVDHDAWLNAPTADQHRPALLVFASTVFPRARVIAALDQSHCGATLGVFAHPDCLADSLLLTSLRDFVSWPCARDELRLRLERVCPPNLVQQADCLSLSSAEFARLNLVGRSSKFLAALGMIERIAACDAPVIIEGETGTGKEAAARAIHYASARRSCPFVPINCGAIPDNLIESELFGHERGAFTDAKEARHGVIAQAEGGTLFLDEVDALSPKAQVTLLRFLQDRQYRPLGSNRMRTADTRIVAATNANLQYQVEQGRFRADLMFRLNILSLHLPPLRERSGDAALLAQYFVDLLSARYRRPTTRIDVVMFAWLE